MVAAQLPRQPLATNTVIAVNVEHKTNRDICPTSLPIDHKSQAKRAQAKTETKKTEGEKPKTFQTWRLGCAICMAKVMRHVACGTTLWPKVSGSQKKSKSRTSDRSGSWIVSTFN